MKSSNVLLASDIQLVQRMYGCGKYFINPAIKVIIHIVFIIAKMKLAKMNILMLLANLWQTLENVRVRKEWIGWQKNAKKPASIVFQIAKISGKLGAKKRQKVPKDFATSLG